MGMWFRMTIDGEKIFDVIRFGADPTSFSPAGIDPAADSFNSGLAGGAAQIFDFIAYRKMMLLMKLSDLATVRLVETYHRHQTIGHIFFVAVVKGKDEKSTHWAASMHLYDVTITDLKTRLPLDYSFFGVVEGTLQYDLVALQAGKVEIRAYDSQGLPLLTPEEQRRLNNG
jgi:hypothetical protein